LSLNKLRVPYEHAAKVLVLDKSLTGVSSPSTQSPSILEAVAHVVCAGWMRRLWTLQEGALPKADSVWFQFADQAISLAFFMAQLNLILLTRTLFNFHGIFYDLDAALTYLRSFRHAEPLRLERFQSSRLHYIDMALKHRSVSRPSDEALCVATLMSVSLPEVSFVLPTSDAEAKIYQDEEAAKDAARKAKDALQVHLDAHPVGGPLMIQAQAVYTNASQSAEEAAKLADIYRKKADSDLHIARMEKLWLLLSASLSGLPAGLIFFPEARIPTPGFRWAPLTFLAIHSGPFDDNMRLHHWKGKHFGQPSPYGLLVEYPGFRLSERVYADGLPRHPWKGCTRVSNHYLLVRGPEGELYRVSADPSGVEVAETIPLPDLVLTDSYAVLMQREIHAGASLPETACMGLLVRVTTTEERKVDGSSFVGLLF
jgi:hypothetical protein